MVSVIITTFNRASTLARAINSVLAQDYKDLDIIVVDDGSTDETRELLRSYDDRRIRVITHEFNRGVCAAKNTGLNGIRGEWFTFLDSDDEMVVPNAISTLLDVSREVDPGINAVTCNCVDFTTGLRLGTGMNSDQFIELKTYLRDLHGEHWGITKTSLLGNDRFHEDVVGMEFLLWYRIQKRAKRYYIHKMLNIIHREGEHRVSETRGKLPLDSRYTECVYVLEEPEYLSDLRAYDQPAFVRRMVRAAILFIEARDIGRAKRVRGAVSGVPHTILARGLIVVALILGEHMPFLADIATTTIESLR